MLSQIAKVPVGKGTATVLGTVPLRGCHDATEFSLKAMGRPGSVPVAKCFCGSTDVGNRNAPAR